MTSRIKFGSVFGHLGISTWSCCSFVYWSTPNSWRYLCQFLKFGPQLPYQTLQENSTSKRRTVGKRRKFTTEAINTSHHAFISLHFRLHFSSSYAKLRASNGSTTTYWRYGGNSTQNTIAVAFRTKWGVQTFPIGEIWAKFGPKLPYQTLQENSTSKTHIFGWSSTWITGNILHNGAAYKKVNFSKILPMGHGFTRRCQIWWKSAGGALRKSLWHWWQNLWLRGSCQSQSVYFPTGPIIPKIFGKGVLVRVGCDLLIISLRS